MGASGRPGRSFLMQGKGALTHHQPGAGSGMACGHRAPFGGGSSEGVSPCPVWTGSADATGGLCIERSCADVLGGLGAAATNKRPVYTEALLATSIMMRMGT